MWSMHWQQVWYWLAVLWDSLLSVLPCYLIITKLEKQPKTHKGSTEAQDQDDGIRSRYGHKKKNLQRGIAVW